MEPEVFRLRWAAIMRAEWLKKALVLKTASSVEPTTKSASSTESTSSGVQLSPPEATNIYKIQAFKSENPKEHDRVV